MDPKYKSVTIEITEDRNGKEVKQIMTLTSPVVHLRRRAPKSKGAPISVEILISGLQQQE